MGEKYKKTCKYLSYVEHWLILASTAKGRKRKRRRSKTKQYRQEKMG